MTKLDKYSQSSLGDGSREQGYLLAMDLSDQGLGVALAEFERTMFHVSDFIPV